MRPSGFYCFMCKRLTRAPHICLITLTILTAWMYLAMTVYIFLSNKAIFSSSLYASNSFVGPRAETLSLFSSACKEKVNFVFIKGMKCATSTLLGVFYHFDYTRNLSFVSPLGNRLYLNWPFPMTKLDFRPSSRGYNILTDHAVFTTVRHVRNHAG
jgi:Galactose-3-O-sulfotransferase